MVGIIEELKRTYKNGSSLIRLLFINLGIFIIFRIVYLILFFSNNTDVVNTLYWFSVPASIPVLLIKPWTLITYMFYHEDIWHIIFNMLWLYWFGKLFLYFFDEKKLVGLYIIGGISGAVFYILAFNAIPVFYPSVQAGAVALGASAAIMAIMVAVSFYAPEYKINLLLFGEVKLIYVALVFILLDVILMSSGNAGGHIAHIGGAFVGWLWIYRYRKGKDFTLPITKVLFNMGNLFKSRSRLKVSHKKPMSDLEFNRSRLDYQKEIDRILDKISKGGYDSLSQEEKETLFKMGEKNK